MCLDDALSAVTSLEARQAKERCELAEVLTAMANLPSMAGTAAEGVKPRLLVNPLYGSRVGIDYGDSGMGGYNKKQFTPMEALRIIERFELASVAVVNTRGSAAIRPSYCPLAEGETYRQGSAYFPAYVEADSWGARLTAWGALRDGQSRALSTKVRIHVHLKEAYKYAQYRPANQKSNRDWGEAGDERVTHWDARPTLPNTQLQRWWAPEGKTSFAYFWLDAQEAMRAMGCEVESFCANYIQE